MERIRDKICSGWRGTSLAALGLALLGLGSPAEASDFYFPLGFGSAGKPNSFAFENWSSFTGSGGGGAATHRFSTGLELAYFTPTGFTGTTRDQFELYGFFWGGWQDPHGGNAGSSGWGFAIPDVGVEYYFQVVQPNEAPKGVKLDPDSWEYFTLWTSPDVTAYFPNGNNYPAGYGSFSNQFSMNVNWQNYARWGRIATTFVPVSATYAWRDLAPTIGAAPTPGIFAPLHNKGGWSISTGIINAEYHVTGDFWMGLYHSYNFYNVADSTYATTREGTIGPAVEYDGFAKQSLYLQATVQTDYYHSAGLKQNTSFIFYLFKYLN